MTLTPDQEKELQKAAEEYFDVKANIDNFSVQKAFIAGAKHQDAISFRKGWEAACKWYVEIDKRNFLKEEEEIRKQLETGESK